MKKPDFTIAVAIYNVAAYLEECIESIVKQMDSGMELLLVDDGSTDGCGAICDEYAQKDSRITAIHQENGGLSAARNTAIEHAAGDWLIFVDGDDRLPANALHAMREYSRDAAQLVIFDYVEFDERGTRSCCPSHGSFVMDTPEALRQYRASTLCRQPALADKFTVAQSMTSWGKMWKSSLIKEHSLCFDTAVRKSEDIVFAFAASRYMDRICVADRCVYEYRQNRFGIMRRFDLRAPEHHRVLISTIREDMSACGETDDPVLMKGLYDLCAGGIYTVLRQTLAHAQCRWSRKERIAWLRELAEADWVKAGKECESDAILLGWMKRGGYGKIDLYCRIIRQFPSLLELLKRLRQ